MSELVSIIVTVFNKEAYVLETVRSALNQTYENIEVIVVDDGSTDDSMRRLEAVKDHRLKVVHMPHGGQCRCRNYGYELSTGEFVGFLDADDLWTETKVESHIAALRNDGTACLAFSSIDLIDGNGNVIFFRAPCAPPTAYYSAMLQGNLLGCGSNAIHRRCTLEEIGLFDPSFVAAPDLDLYVRLARRYPFALVQEKLVKYRRADLQASLNVAEMEKSIWRIFKREYGQAPGCDLPKSHRQVSLDNSYRYLRDQSIRNLKNPNTNFKRALESARILLRAHTYIKGINRLEHCLYDGCVILWALASKTSFARCKSVQSGQFDFSSASLVRELGSHPSSCPIESEVGL